jgi:hypothetical protein
MKSLKVLGIINLVVITITMLCIFGEAESITVGLWTLLALGLAVAQSIIGIVVVNKYK